MNPLKYLWNYLSGKAKCPRVEKTISNDNIKLVSTLTPTCQTTQKDNVHLQRFYQHIYPQSFLSPANGRPALYVWQDWLPTLPEERWKPSLFCPSPWAVRWDSGSPLH